MASNEERKNSRRPKVKSDSLAAYVSRVRSEKHLTLVDVVTNSQMRLTDTWVSRVERGRIENPSMAKLEALASGLRVPAKELFDVCFGGKATAQEQSFVASDAFLVHQMMESETSEAKRHMAAGMLRVIIEYLKKTDK